MASEIFGKKYCRRLFKYISSLLECSPPTGFDSPPGHISLGTGPLVEDVDDFGQVFIWLGGKIAKPKNLSKIVLHLFYCLLQASTWRLWSCMRSWQNADGACPAFISSSATRTTWGWRRGGGACQGAGRRAPPHPSGGRPLSAPCSPVPPHSPMILGLCSLAS